MRLIVPATLIVCLALVPASAWGLQTTAPAPPASDTQPPTQTFTESVIVTAEKWDADRAKVPLALSVITPADLQTSGAQLLNQIAPQVPGLFLRVDGDRSFNKPSLRGITSSPFNDPAVTVYIDDVPVDPRMGLATPLAGIERIEVIRGPAGVIWGRNTSGGVMNVVSVLPTNTWTHGGGLSFGSAGEVLVPFSVQGPVVAGKVYFGLSGQFDRRGGYLDNPTDPGNVDTRGGGFGRLLLRWTPSAAWDVQVRSDTGIWRDGAFLAEPVGNPDPYVVRSDTDAFEDSEVFQQSVRVRREARTWSMTGIASRRAVAVDTLRDEDYRTSPLREETSSNLNDTRTTAEVRLQSAGTARFRWLGGMFAATRDATDGYQTYLPVIFQGYSDRNSASYYDRTLSAFGQAGMPLGARVGLTLGVRLDSDRKSMQRDARTYGWATTSTADDFVAPAYAVDDTFTFVSPRASLDFALSSSVIAYGSISRGARSGGFNFVTDSPSRSSFNGEYVTSIEGGVKGRSPGGRFEGGAAVYHSDIRDLQFQQFNEGFFAVANAGEATSRGVELEGVVRPVDGLTIRSAYAFTDAVLDQFNNGFADLSGNLVPAVPRYTLMAAAEYRRTSGVEAGVELVAQGRTFFDEANQVVADPYRVLNLRTGVDLERWGITLYLRNATEARYVTMIAPGFYQVPGAPRRFGVTLRVGSR